jgi:hypothetical protein
MAEYMFLSYFMNALNNILDFLGGNVLLLWQELSNRKCCLLAFIPDIPN